MKAFPGSMKVKITQMIDGKPSTWIATSLIKGGSPEKTIEWLNKQAASQGLEVTYATATEEEYWAYRDQVRAQIKEANS